MNNVHKMSLKRSLRYSYLIVILILIAPASGAFLFIFSSNSNTDGLLKGFCVVSLITGLAWFPGLFLHLSYYYNDRGKQITITKTSIQFNNFPLEEMKFKDILKLEQVDATDFSRLPWGDYGFTKITLKDNSEIKITCLTINPFDFALEISRHTDCKLEKTSFAFPHLASV
jgi:hypothetical protein